MKTQQRPDASAVAVALTHRIEQLATSLLGEPNRAASTRHQWRWGRKGSLALEVAGARRGVFCCHESGVGGDALDLVAYARRCTKRDAWEWAIEWLGSDLESADRVPAPAPRPPDAPKKTLPIARQLWIEASSAVGTPVETYLTARGLALPSDAPLRFHAACPRGSDGERLPAMIALMTDALTGDPVGVHRTFLLNDGSGKAAGDSKKMLGGSGLVRLVPDHLVTIGLGIAEGLETSLAVMQRASWAPVWAACSAGAIAALPVLRGIEALTIFADADDRTGAGLKAARACAARWSEAGAEATVRVPPAGCDWDDVTRRVAA